MRGWDQALAHDQENAGTSLRLHVVVVMTNQDIPATNSGSERALRPCAGFRKIADGFRSEWGAKLYADIRSVIVTARRRSIGALEAVHLTLAGTPLADSM
jgi:transposase